MCSYSLDREELASYCYGVFKVRADQVRHDRVPGLRPVSQNSTAFVEVDVLLGELGNRTAVAIYWPSAYRTLMLRYP